MNTWTSKLLLRITADPQQFLSALLREACGTCTQSPFFDIICILNFCLQPHKETLWKQLSWEHNKETGSGMESAKTVEKTNLNLTDNFNV